MLEFEEEHLPYITDFRVEYTNTITERCIRVAMAKRRFPDKAGIWIAGKIMRISS